MFREIVVWYGSGRNISLPLLPSLDPYATILAIAAAVALFRFEVSVMRTLVACSLAGVVLQFAFEGAL